MIDNITGVIDAFTRLVGVLTWPVVLVIAFSYFAPSLQIFLVNLKEGSIEAFGFKISGKAEATNAVVNALRQNLVADATKAVDSLSAAANQTSKSAKQILWVDDNPSNNTFVKQAFETLGFQMINVLTTNDALESLKRRKFDLVISKMGRPEGRLAGYDLLAKLKEENISIHFIIYSGVNTEETKAETIKRGAFASTNRPDELLHYAADALTKS